MLQTSKGSSGFYGQEKSKQKKKKTHSFSIVRLHGLLGRAEGQGSWGQPLQV